MALSRSAAKVSGVNSSLCLLFLLRTIIRLEISNQNNGNSSGSDWIAFLMPNILSGGDVGLQQCCVMQSEWRGPWLHRQPAPWPLSACWYCTLFPRNTAKTTHHHYHQVRASAVKTQLLQLHTCAAWTTKPGAGANSAYSLTPPNPCPKGRLDTPTLF